MRENDLTWFRPLWKRVGLTAAIVFWSALEWWNGDQTWGIITLCLVAYCVWTFFIAFPAAPGPGPGPDEPPSA